MDSNAIVEKAELVGERAWSGASQALSAAGTFARERPVVTAVGVGVVIALGAWLYARR
jgi:hypothetical protein